MPEEAPVMTATFFARSALMFYKLRQTARQHGNSAQALLKMRSATLRLPSRDHKPCHRLSPSPSRQQFTDSWYYLHCAATYTSRGQQTLCGFHQRPHCCCLVSPACCTFRQSVQDDIPVPRSRSCSLAGGTDNSARSLCEVLTIDAHWPERDGNGRMLGMRVQQTVQPRKCIFGFDFIAWFCMQHHGPFYSIATASAAPAPRAAATRERTLPRPRTPRSA